MTSLHHIFLRFALNFLLIHNKSTEFNVISLIFLAIAARLWNAGGKCHSPSFVAQSGLMRVGLALPPIRLCGPFGMGAAYFDKRKGIISRIARA